MIGETLGHYRIESELGAGGMGVVYKAYDAVLERPVAVKVVRADRLGDPRRRERFLREARAASALSHPGIVTIHEIRSEAGVDFIVMEYVEGEPLDRLLGPRGLPAREALDYAVQIARALARIHAAGILHRDVKPSNVMVTPEGRVKILDFGLAKPADLGVRPAVDAPTELLLTQEGALVGTPDYMSPEQVEGRPPDARSDVFGFGALLYEMLTGRRPFAADSPLRVLTRIVGEEPTPPSHFGTLSEPLERIVLRCLRKDPARRFQTMDDLALALEDLRGNAPTAPAARPPGKASRRAATVAAVVAIAAAGVVLVWRATRPAPGAPPRETALTTFAGRETYPALSADGRQVAFTWDGPGQDNLDVYVQLVGSGPPLRLTTDPRRDLSPAWSPDGRWIAFLRGRPQPLDRETCELLLVPPLGGPERRIGEVRVRELGDVPDRWIAWCPDGRCLVVTDSPDDGRPDALFVVSLETGEKRQLTWPAPPALGDTDPAFSPDGGSLAFRRTVAWGAGELHVLPLTADLRPAGEPRRLTDPALNALNPVWMPDGEALLLATQGALWRISADGSGTPEPIPFVGGDGFLPTTAPSPTGDGTRLVFARSASDVNVWRLDLPAIGAPATSPPRPAITSTRLELHGKLSPDGRRVVFTSTRSGAWELWSSDPDGGNATQLTALGARTTGGPSWSPDGRSIAFASNLEGEFEIYVVAAAGGAPRRVTVDPAFDQAATFSRDGRRLYFTSNRGGTFEIWRSGVDGGEPRQVTTGGGWSASESADGATLFFLRDVTASSASLWRMPTAGGDAVQLADGVVWWSFWVLAGGEGIYFIDRDGPTTRLRFLDLASGETRTLATGLGETDCCVTASPDGRTVLYSRVDSWSDDLVLVDELR